jgi:DNA-binding response OmpR family regulator
MRNSQTARILVVDDERPSRDLCRRLLERDGYDVQVADGGAAAMARLAQEPPDVVLLDVAMPGLDGFAVCRAIKQSPPTRFTPVVFVTGSASPAHRLKGIDAGADDFLTKPFGMAELHARVRAALRRALGAAAAAGGQVRIGPLVLDPMQRRVSVSGTDVHLTPREYELLKTLLANTGRVAGRGRLLRAVWGDEYVHEGHYLHVHVAAIRRKLEVADPSGALRRLIVAVPGVGYRVADAEQLEVPASGS